MSGDRSEFLHASHPCQARAITRQQTESAVALTWIITAIVITCLSLLALRSAQAAPQILGLVASNATMPLHCENGLCATEASVFCLQKWRMSPVTGTSYTPAGGEGLHLVALTRAGEEIIVPNPELKITALRGHSAVLIGVDVDWMYKRNYQSVSLKIGQKVSLIPDAWAGDPRPQTTKDMAMALGPLRDLGHKLVDTAGRNVTTAQVLAKIGGKLPRLGRAHDDVRNAAWKAGTEGLREVNAKAMKKAKAKFDRCHDVTFGGSTSLRQCLGAQHDILIGKLNARYWSASEYGM